MLYAILFVKRCSEKRHRVPDEQDLAGGRALRECGGQLFPLGLVVGEADFDEAVVGERLIDGGDECIGHAVVPYVDHRSEFLRTCFEFAQARFAHMENLKSV